MIHPRSHDASYTSFHIYGEYVVVALYVINHSIAVLYHHNSSYDIIFHTISYY